MSMVNANPGKISVRDLNFYYGKFHALKNINLDIAKNQVTAFIGPSGCGKSTMMNIIGGMDYPTSGELIIEGKDYSHPSEKDLTENSYTNIH